MFPPGLFYILSRKHGFALDVYDGQTKEGANIIVWPQKFQDSDNQLWTFDNGRLINKKSGLVLDISSSAFKKDKTIVQKERKANKQSQEWIYDQGFICSKEYPSLVLDIRGDSNKGGAQVLLYKRKDTDNLNQLWQLESYQKIEGALNMATTSVPLHKKEGFGQPRPGYGAEPGVPPELNKVPENNKIAGIGNTNAATPTTNKVDESRTDPSLAQYGSFYGGTSTANPAPQAGPTASTGYPPQHMPSTNDYPPPPQPGPTPSSPYPQSPNLPSNYQQPQHSNNLPAFPQPSSYPPAPSSPSGYNAGYPGPGGPSFPNPGFPQGPSGASGFPEPGNMGVPSSGMGMPAPGNQHQGYPPPPVPDRPSNQHAQYGYPSYPQ
ncbi:ricin B lectin domain-containing protein [Mycotypha africana]|uniref:ricin B lectin domain-containing protein n=1 Tax=Mycotypha africana TaxID=64632 RepID=UPI002300B7DF|nr:ricin B lectin domain-containing protein [Mycotypha africana]KAI8971881.1 ricin B lectin domain-containing protein [Mycotypha africana]